MRRERLADATLEARLQKIEKTLLIHELPCGTYIKNSNRCCCRRRRNPSAGSDFTPKKGTISVANGVRITILLDL